MSLPLKTALCITGLLVGCTGSSSNDGGQNPTSDASQLVDSGAAQTGNVADVTQVSIQGTSFSVTIKSPDTGCSQYADWWEVLSTDGQLLYRRILAHSHVNEQPFTRSGGPAAIPAGADVVVRAHMNPGGYGGQALIGQGDSFRPYEVPAGFAAGVESEAPLPSDCAF